MAKSFFKLDTRRPLKDGTFPIVLAIGYGRNMYVTTGVSAATADWDKTSQCYTGKGAKSVNAVLKTLLATTSARILELREAGTFDNMDNKQLKAMLQNPDAKTSKPAAPTIGDMFNAMMAAKSKRTGEIYASTVMRLKSYCDINKLHFDDINKMWLDGFVASMADLSPNTKSIHLRNLRAVNNYAVDCEITSNYPFRRYKMPKPTTRKRSFNVAVLRNLFNLPLSDALSKYRDIFKLTFYLVGINFIDLCGLTQISDGRIEYRRAKTHKPYSIRVEAEAMAIIQKMSGKKHLLNILDICDDYRNYYQTLCRGLDAVKKAYNERYPEAPIAELTTYWARHSWATIAASLDIPKETIAAALGHDMGNSTTAIYIDFDRSKVDAANRRVIDWVLYGKR